MESLEPEQVCMKIEFSQLESQTEPVSNLHSELIKNDNDDEQGEYQREPGEYLPSCSICQREFTHKKNLYAHFRNIHKIEPLKKQEPKIECLQCSAKFISKSSLLRHKRNFHPNPDMDHDYSGPSRKTRLTCPFDGCSEAFMLYCKLREHLKDAHDFVVELEERTFENTKEFCKWKSGMQARTLSKYVCDTSLKTLSNGSTRGYYNCHRSYHFRSRGKNKRQIKARGSNKIDRACPARIEVRIAPKDSQEVHIKFWKTHCGHKEDANRITLDRSVREKIAALLREGVPFDNILEVVRDPLIPLGTKYGRLRLLDRKDMHNIVRDFKIDYSPIQIENDTKKWIAEILDSDQDEEENGEVYYLEDDDLKDEFDEAVNIPEILEKLETVNSLIQNKNLNSTAGRRIESHIDNIIEILLKEAQPIEYII